MKKRAPFILTCEKTKLLTLLFFEAKVGLVVFVVMASNEKKIRIMYLHGLEGSPQGDKVQYLSKYFSVFAPKLIPKNPFYCIRLAISAIQEFHPHVVIGSSYGGALLTWLIQQGEWNGPSVLLAPALGIGLPYSVWLPKDAPAIVVQGTEDEIVPMAHSQRLVESGKSSSEALFPELVVVQDQHKLCSLLVDDKEDTVNLRDLVVRLLIQKLGNGEGPYSVELAEKVVAGVDPLKLFYNGSWGIWSPFSLGLHAVWEIPLSFVVKKIKWW